MHTLSKSKLLAFRQCPKRLWLEVHSPQLRKDSAATKVSFDVGHQIGDIARKLYDPNGTGVLLNINADGFNTAFTRTQELLQAAQPIFEACFRAEGALALADVMMPVNLDGKLTWRMIEVKSSTSIKDYHHDDAAIQTLIALSSGVPLIGVSIAHIDSSWVYPGNEDYNGLLVESELTQDVINRGEEVRSWIAESQKIVNQQEEPSITTGKHCTYPYECGYIEYCKSHEPQADKPISWLPGRFKNELRAFIDMHHLTDLRDLPDELLSQKQQVVKDVSISGEPYFDKQAAAAMLASYKLPAYFLDFETIQFAVPIWKGTRPYQQIPFQFSLHTLMPSGKLEQKAFLDLSGADPSQDFARELITACGADGPIFVYNAGFETARIRELAERYPQFARPLLALNERVVDLLPIARDCYYHPSQKGSWSIKAVLPALCPDLNYGNLEGVQDGGMAMDAFLEALSPQTSHSRKSEIEQQLLAYCALDTLAMVRLWSIFSGSEIRY